MKVSYSKQNNITTDLLLKLFKFEIKGSNQVIKNLGRVNSAGKNILTFAENEKYLKVALRNSSIVAIIVHKDFHHTATNKILLLTNSPRHIFYKIHNHLLKKTNFYGKRKKSVISKYAKVHETSFIDKYNVSIGKNVVIDPYVSIFNNTRIEDNVVIHANTVIGTDGFQHYHLNNKIINVPHAAGVRIEKGVEIGANCCIAKGLFNESTLIGKFTQIDTFVNVSHDVKIGERCSITSHVEISGRTIIGDDVSIAPGAVILNQVKIGNKSIIGIGSVVTQDIPENVLAVGHPARVIKNVESV